MKNILITGGSSGIGLELARVFGMNGHQLIINGSNYEKLLVAKEKLENEFGKPVLIFVEDLSQANGPKSLYDHVCKAGIEVDILINNAGIGLMDSTEKIDFDSDQRLMQLNVIALVQLCKLFLPRMYERKNGKILNIASIAAFQPGPYNSTYFASKAFVLSYSRAIRFEAKKHGVEVSTLCPGTTKTNFFEREGSLAPPMAVEPCKVAEYAYKKFVKNKEIIIPGIFNKTSLLIPLFIRIRLSSMMTRLQDK